MKIGDTEVGDKLPCYIVAEIGINHDGDMDKAQALVEVAGKAGCNAVKFQKRDPESCVPKDQWNVPREWNGEIVPYIEYRKEIELTLDQLQILANRAKHHHSMDTFCSVWDEKSVGDMMALNMPAIKVPSPCITDIPLLEAVAATGKPVLYSTGMSTKGQIGEAARVLCKAPCANYIAMHSTSVYPCEPEELNLRCINELKNISPNGVGYSGHERGLQVTLAAVAMGACVVERHITLDRTLRGTDHAASIEPKGLQTLVRDIRIIEAAMGDGIKKVYDSERPAMDKLRRVQ